MPRGTQGQDQNFHLRLPGSHRLWPAFPEPFDFASVPSVLPSNPAWLARRFGLLPFRSPLLGKSSLLLRVLRCFTSPGSPRQTISSSGDAWACPHAGFPIRIPPALRVHTPHQSFSQCTASFIGVWRQGIPRVLLVAYPHCDAEKLMFSRYFTYALVKLPQTVARPLPASPLATTRRPTPHGDEGTRTPDLCLAKASLSPLSYVPLSSCGSDPTRTGDLSLIRRVL